MRDVQHLQGVRDDAQAHIGTCWYKGRVMQFRFWFPHIGIAVDDVMPVGGELEVEARREWCVENAVLYFGPTDVTDLDMLRELAAERRAVAS